MLAYALKRLCLAALICLLAVTILFVMIHAVPGDPVSIMLGPRATPEMKAALESKMSLDQPLPVQILVFFGNLLRGDLGTDIFSNRPVAARLLQLILETRGNHLLTRRRGHRRRRSGLRRLDDGGRVGPHQQSQQHDRVDQQETAEYP